MSIMKIVSFGTILVTLSAASVFADDCVSNNKDLDEFANNCPYEVIIAYRTVGGGCFEVDKAIFKLAPGMKSIQPLLSTSCGNGTTFSVEWKSCNLTEYEKGNCKLDFN
ncbi:hypothetical protein [Profundibacter sp.]|uniref:hypothetical protein n=1 Tax=Profundibacter sp. TaxID=3101071 RepID=UPI003D14A60D